MKRSNTILVFLLICLLAAGGCSKSKQPKTPGPENKAVVLATTTSTKDSGLLDQLLPAFEQKSGYQVKVISQGTGQALKTGELGDCDVVLVHSRAAEDEFVKKGFGVNRQDVMYNDYVVVGPTKDPAAVKGLPVLQAMQKIAASAKVKFLSRGDDSGTHKKELELWALLAKKKPAGDWYLAVGKGMGDTLIMAGEMGAYTLADRGTYASMKDKLKLEILVEGDKNLLNPYGVIAVNPAKHPKVNKKGAMAFVEFITSPAGKEIINSYKVNGQQLFFAN